MAYFYDLAKVKHDSYFIPGRHFSYFENGGLFLPEKNGEIYLPGQTKILYQPKEYVELGGNICFRGITGSGKTLGMIAFCARLVKYFGFDWNEVYANLMIYSDKAHDIPMPGTHYLDNDAIKKFIHRVYRGSKGKIRHIIIMIDEIDQVYPHLFSAKDVEAAEDLLTLWQDLKLEIFFLYTKHLGFGCNKLIRSATEVSIRPMFDNVHKLYDLLELNIIDGWKMEWKQLSFENVSQYYKLYKRKQYIN